LAEEYHESPLEALFHKHQILLLKRFRQGDETRTIFRHGLRDPHQFGLLKASPQILGQFMESINITERFRDS